MKTLDRIARPAFALLLLAAAGSAGAASSSNGSTLYDTHCVACHGQVNFPINWSATTIRNAINSNTGGMSILSGLTDAELTDISAFLSSPTGNDSDRLFDWAEGQYASMLSPPTQSQTISGYYVRYYSTTDVYVATRDGRLYYYEPGNPSAGVIDLGSVTDWLSRAGL